MIKKIIFFLVVLLSFSMALAAEIDPIISEEVLFNIQTSKEIYYDLIEKDTELIKEHMLDFIGQEEYKLLFLEKDRDGLYESSLGLYEDNKDQHLITHFYYEDLNDSVFLRVHNKDKFGDTLERSTFWLSKESNSWGDGLELGETAFALRVVHPYEYNNELIGYIEFGKEIEEYLLELMLI